MKKRKEVYDYSDLVFSVKMALSYKNWAKITMDYMLFLVFLITKKFAYQNLKWNIGLSLY